MIFGCSFGKFENGVNGQLYSKYPEVLFEQATGLQIKKNQSEYFGAGEDTIYLSGMAAGAATQEGPDRLHRPVRRSPRSSATSTRSRSARRRCTRRRRVRLIWTNAWFSPPKETAAAKNLIAAGVDVLGQNVDSPAAGVVAESKRVPWVGYDSDAQKSAPKQWLTAATYNWGPYYVKRVRAAIERHVEVRLLLRHDQGRLHRARSVRPEGIGEDEGGDRGEAEGDRLRQVQRLPGAALRPEGKAEGQEGQEAEGAAGPVLDAVARQGRRRQGLVGRCLRASAWGSPPLAQ